MHTGYRTGTPGSLIGQGSGWINSAGVLKPYPIQSRTSTVVTPWGDGFYGYLRTKPISGWTIGTVLRYQSALPIAVPTAWNSLGTQLGRGTLANRVAGQPLSLKDPSCRCYDPRRISS